MPVFRVLFRSFVFVRSVLPGDKKRALPFLTALFALWVTVAMTTTASASIINRKISGTVLGYVGALESWMSPDGQWVVFSGFTAIGEPRGLFWTPADGSEAPTRLDSPHSHDSDFRDVIITPDSSHVLFIASDPSLPDRLFSAELGTSSPPVQLSDPLYSAGAIIELQVSPDGKYAVFLADFEIDNTYQLYSVPVDGSALPVRLNESPVTGGDVWEYAISPDSTHVVYWGDLETDEVHELTSVSIDGSTGPDKRSGPLVSGGDVERDFAISPDSSRIVFRADKEVDGLVELYSVPIQGSSLPTELNGPLIPTGRVFRFTISPDSNRVLYLADEDTDDVWELYSAPLEGGSAAVKLNPPLVSGGNIFEFQVTPDSTRVVYHADQLNDEVYELGSVPIEGGQGVRLNGPLAAGGDVDREFLISPDSSRVIYRADQETDEVYELYSARVDGSDWVKLNAPLIIGGDVEDDYQIAPDSSRVVYRADQEVNNVYELYSAPLDGLAPPEKLNGALAQNGDVDSFTFSEDGRWAIYLADESSDGVYELYRADAAGAEPAMKLNGPLVSGGDVESFSHVAISPDGRRTVYRADQETDGLYELYVTYEEQELTVSFTAESASAPEDGGSATVIVQLNEPAGAATVAVDYAVTGGTASGGGVDFDLASGTLLFAQGVISQTITINLVDDGLVEGDETVVISLSNPQNASLTSPDTLTLTIVDDDTDEAAPAYGVFLPLLRRE